tara:strand:- start:475 stop:1992 length:1518 start_codon:yes stop_codon:yes gene_type:complete
MNKNGGKPINAGGYGCLFKPALKCKGKKRRKKTVSKVLLNQHAESEYDTIEFFKNKLKEIPDYSKYFMIDNIEICKPDRLTKSDLTKFNEVCVNLKNFSSKTINNNLDKIKIINIPDGGIDLDKFITNTNITAENFIVINSLMINLLKNAVIPMNNKGVLHLDIKANNIMVSEDSNVKLIDWGLSHFNDGKIPNTILHFPITFNMPFSSILLNHNFETFINNIISKNPDILNHDSLNTASLKTTIINYMYFLFKDAGLGQFAYLNMILSNLYLPFMPSTDVNDLNNLSIYYFTMNHIVDYIIPIIRKFTKKNRFSPDEYYNTVFVKNVDIWGFLMCYEKYLYLLSQPKLSDNKLTKSDNKNLYMLLREIYIDILFSNPTQVIDTNKLLEKLNNLNKIFITIKNVKFETPIKSSKSKSNTKKIKYTPYPSKKTRTKNSLFNNAKKNITQEFSRGIKNLTSYYKNTKRNKSHKKRHNTHKKRHYLKPYHKTKSSLYTNKQLDTLFNL